MSRAISPGRRSVEIVVDGSPRRVPAGASIAAALLAGGHPDVMGTVAVFCGMGSCYGCVAIVDGRPGVRTCLTPVHDGMNIGTTNRSERHG